MKKIIYKILYPLARIYWFVVRPETRGVKCLVEYDNQFLLVKLGYAHRRWTIPGGGVNRKETYKEAAQREIMEETGIAIGSLTLIGLYQQIIEYKNDTVEVYYAVTTKNKTGADYIEVDQVGWFARENLPKDRTPQVDKILKMYDEYCLIRK